MVSTKDAAALAMRDSRARMRHRLVTADADAAYFSRDGTYAIVAMHRHVVGLELATHPVLHFRDAGLHVVRPSVRIIPSARRFKSGPRHPAKRLVTVAMPIRLTTRSMSYGTI